MILPNGGHGYEILADNTFVLEIKNGPHMGADIDRKRLHFGNAAETTRSDGRGLSLDSPLKIADNSLRKDKSKSNANGLTGDFNKKIKVPK